MAVLTIVPNKIPIKLTAFQKDIQRQKEGHREGRHSNTLFTHNTILGLVVKNQFSPLQDVYLW